jgi:hypothetical protein
MIKFDANYWDPINGRLRELHRTMVNEQVEAITNAENKLTEEQFVACVRQAIVSGDFFKVVATDGRQQMLYIPFKEKMQLEMKVIELEKKLIAVRKALE